MRTKITTSVFLLIFYFTTFHSYALSPLVGEENDQYIHVLASLVFHTQEWEECLNKQKLFPETLVFSTDEATSLWTKLYHTLDRSQCTSKEKIDKSYVDLSYQHYEQTKEFIDAGQLKEAQQAMNSSSSLLRKLWGEALLSEEQINKNHLVLREKNDPNFYENPYISESAKKAMAPYLLPLHHPTREFLDHLCLQNRITLNKNTFHQAGFKTFAKGPRSYICVAKHREMPGYLIKAYLDTVLQKKQKKTSWKWLVCRCEGAQKVRDIIDQRQIKHFIVPKKWIYCLPAEPSPPQDGWHTRHLALLVVNDMELAPKEQNHAAWYSLITKKHLNELYAIISRAKGSSYRADNIAFTKHGKFAFIDTEYPSRGPDYKNIRKHLNPEMLDYWDKLVKRGGYIN